MKAFALLEFLVFIAILNVMILAILGTLKLQLSFVAEHSSHDIFHNITICNKIEHHCVFESQFLDSLPFFEISTNP